VVLRWICENLHLDVTAQIQRIKRTEVIADDLLYVRIQMVGGSQVMPTLLLRAVPYWLLLRRGVFRWKNGVEQKNLDSVTLFCYPSNGRSSSKSSKGVVHGHKAREQRRRTTHVKEADIHLPARIAPCESTPGKPDGLSTTPSNALT
jgi:hypothetical protein